MVTKSALLYADNATLEVRMDLPDKPANGDPHAAEPASVPSRHIADLDAIDAARAEKIEKIRKALADGTYHVSAEEVARKLIEHMLEPKS
jgi:flagellar biosynthesis anti-sigma factor FlgM